MAMDRNMLSDETRMNLYRAVFEQVADGIFVFDRQGCCLGVNPQGCHLLGYSQTEILNFDVATLLPPAAHALRPSLDGPVADQVVAWEQQLRRKGGSLFWAEIKTQLLSNGHQLTFVRDITERKRTEQRLQELTDTLAATQNVEVQERHHAERLQVLADAAYAFTQASADYQELLDLVARTTAATLGDVCTIRLLSADQKWLEVVAFHDMDPALFALAKTSWGVLPLSVEEEPGRQAFVSAQPLLLPTIDRDRLRAATLPEFGSLIDIAQPQSMIFAPLRVQGRVIGLLHLLRHRRTPRSYTTEDLQMAQDLADRAALAISNAQLYADVQAELERRQATEATLRESESRFRALIDASAQIVWTAAANGAAVEDSPSWCAFTGQSREERLGFGWMAAVHQEDRTRTALNWRAAAMTGLPFTDEVRLHHASGEWRWMIVRAVPLLHPNGAVRAWIGMNTDITERKQAEAMQAKLEAQLRQAQKMESVGRLAGGIAHDFNNLLTVIQGYCDLIQLRLSAVDPVRNRIALIQQASERATTLTSQLLAFSRKQILAPTVLDLNALVTDLQQLLVRIIGEDIVLQTHLSSAVWPVTADSGQIEQVLMNLVVNARDAMPTGGQLTIETQNVILDDDYAKLHPDLPPGPCVLVAVSDTGCGMSKEIQTQIFEPFFTTKERDKGTGLGLSTAYGIVKQSGGDITVYSEPGQGATFKIYLPASEVGSKITPPVPRQFSSQHGSETILVVEDEEMVRKLVHEALQDQGYTILEARNGQAALTLLAQYQGRVDLMLTDVIMPQMSGRELAERVQERYPQIQVLFTSGYTDDAVVRHGLLEPEVNFLSKPFSPSALAAKIREVFDR